jgi:uncharacterized protein (UPF0332 family)
MSRMEGYVDKREREGGLRMPGYRKEEGGKSIAQGHHFLGDSDPCPRLLYYKHMQQDITIYLTKAAESLQTAESEFANGRYNSCANRCYYACFQAAIAALLAEGIRARGQWSHEFVQGQFVGVLMNQRHLYETQLRRVLADNQHVRERPIYNVPRKLDRSLR